MTRKMVQTSLFPCWWEVPTFRSTRPIVFEYCLLVTSPLLNRQHNGFCVHYKWSIYSICHMSTHYYRRSKWPWFSFMHSIGARLSRTVATLSQTSLFDALEQGPGVPSFALQSLVVLAVRFLGSHTFMLLYGVNTVRGMLPSRCYCRYTIHADCWEQGGRLCSQSSALSGIAWMHQPSSVSVSFSASVQQYLFR